MNLTGLGRKEKLSVECDPIRAAVISESVIDRAVTKSNGGSTDGNDGVVCSLRLVFTHGRSDGRPCFRDYLQCPVYAVGEDHGYKWHFVIVNQIPSIPRHALSWSVYCRACVDGIRPEGNSHLKLFPVVTRAVGAMPDDILIFPGHNSK